MYTTGCCKTATAAKSKVFFAFQAQHVPKEAQKNFRGRAGPDLVLVCFCKGHIGLYAR